MVLSIEAVGTLQLLHQLHVVLLGGRGSDLVFLGNFLPRIVLVFLLFKAARISQDGS